MVDVLDIVQVVEHIHKAFEHRFVFITGQWGGVLGNKLDFIHIVIDLTEASFSAFLALKDSVGCKNRQHAIFIFYIDNIHIAH